MERNSVRRFIKKSLDQSANTSPSAQYFLLEDWSNLPAEGESLPGPTFRIGNTNSRIRFPLDPVTFVTRWSEEGPTHHCALGVGAVSAQLLRVGHLLGVPMVSVT